MQKSIIVIQSFGFFLKDRKTSTFSFTFSSLLFPPNDSNLTLIGSFLLALSMGGVGGVGVGVTKFCNNLFGGGSWCCCVVTPSTVFVATFSLGTTFTWYGWIMVWTGDFSVWLWCNWWDFSRCATNEQMNIFKKVWIFLKSTIAF